MLSWRKSTNDFDTMPMPWWHESWRVSLTTIYCKFVFYHVLRNGLQVLTLQSTAAGCDVGLTSRLSFAVLRHHAPPTVASQCAQLTPIRDLAHVCWSVSSRESIRIYVGCRTVRSSSLTWTSLHASIWARSQVDLQASNCTPSFTYRSITAWPKPGSFVRLPYSRTERDKQMKKKTTT